MAAENRFCAMCSRNTPTLYCPCSGSRVNLCGECVWPHMKKNPELRHAMLPIEISAADSTEYLQEMERFAAGKAELEQIPTKIDKCCYELTEAVDFVVANLVSYRDECVGQLQAWKASLSVEIAEAVGEVQAALSGKKVEFRSKYSHSLRNFEPGNFDSLSSLVDSESKHAREVLGSWQWLHQYLTQLRPSGPQEICRTEETRKVVPTNPPRIVYVDGDTGVYEFTRAENGIPVGRQLYQFERERNVDPPFISCGSSYTLLDAERLISCGFDPTEPAAYRETSAYLHRENPYPYPAETVHRENRENPYPSYPVQLERAYIVFLNGATKFVQLPNMNYSRMLTGIVKHADYVYVFGSGQPSTGAPADYDRESYTSGEYLSISAGGPWTLASGAMSAQRYSFTPCVMGNFIYLCGGPKSNTIDLFDIERKSFAGCAEVQLPEASGCIAFVRGSAELVVISNTKVSVFPILSGTLQQGESKDHRTIDIQPNSTPVLFPGDGLSIYFISNVRGKGKCVRFILESDNSVRAIDEVSA